MRDFLSKSIAGGLSAGVVLLWWPVLFDRVDTVTSWFVRGVAWTVIFELLLVALMPFERALWETAHGERIVRRMGSAGSRLHSGSHRRRMSRLSAVASVALALPVILLVAGLHRQAPVQPAAAPVKVVRVTKIVRPITIRRVVEQPQVTAAPQHSAPVSVPRRVTEEPAPSRGRAVVGPTAPVQRHSAPKKPVEAAPQSSVQPAVGSVS